MQYSSLEREKFDADRGIERTSTGGSSFARNPELQEKMRQLQEFRENKRLAQNKTVKSPHMDVSRHFGKRDNINRFNSVEDMAKMGDSPSLVDDSIFPMGKNGSREHHIENDHPHGMNNIMHSMSKSHASNMQSLSDHHQSRSPDYNDNHFNKSSNSSHMESTGHSGHGGLRDSNPPKTPHPDHLHTNID